MIWRNFFLPSSPDEGLKPTDIAEDDPNDVELLFCLSFDDCDCPVELKDEEESSGEFFEDLFLFVATLAPDDDSSSEKENINWMRLLVKVLGQYANFKIKNIFENLK